MPRLIREIRRPTRYRDEQEKKTNPRAESHRHQSTIMSSPQEMSPPQETSPPQEMAPLPMAPILSGAEDRALQPVPPRGASVEEVKSGFVLDNRRLFGACTWENLSEAMKWVIMEELSGVEEDYGRASQFLKLDSAEYNAFIDLGIRENNREELRENLKEAIIDEISEHKRMISLKKHIMSKKEFAKQWAQVSTDLDHDLERIGGPRTYMITKDDLAQAKRFLNGKFDCSPGICRFQRRLKLYTNEVWQFPLVIYAKGEEDDPNCFITLSDNEEDRSTSKDSN